VEIARLVLDYLQTLIWPAVVVFILVKFNRYIVGLLSRITRESQEISASIMGMQLTTKFGTELAALATAASTADAQDLRKSVMDKAREFAREQFRVLANSFVTAPHSVRVRVADFISEVAVNLELEDLFEFSQSPIDGERVGSAIGLRVHMQSSKSACQDARVLTTIQQLLHDWFPRVRYRAIEALRACPELAKTSRISSERWQPPTATMP
jgi:hypothetical protein